VAVTLAFGAANWFFLVLVDREAGLVDAYAFFEDVVGYECIADLE
jgi:hypothetical protein